MPDYAQVLGIIKARESWQHPQCIFEAQNLLPIDIHNKNVFSEVVDLHLMCNSPLQKCSGELLHGWHVCDIRWNSTKIFMSQKLIKHGESASF